MSHGWVKGTYSRVLSESIALNRIWNLGIFPPGAICFLHIQHLLNLVHSKSVLPSLSVSFIDCFCSFRHAVRAPPERCCEDRAVHAKRPEGEPRSCQADRGGGSPAAAAMKRKGHPGRPLPQQPPHGLQNHLRCCGSLGVQAADEGSAQGSRSLPPRRDLRGV